MPLPTMLGDSGTLISSSRRFDLLDRNMPTVVVSVRRSRSWRVASGCRCCNNYPLLSVPPSSSGFSLAPEVNGSGH
jgi:hypothetical protein